MNRLLVCTGVTLVLSLAPAFAIDNSQPPTQPGATPEAASKATTPSAGTADTSGGAKEQSSAPHGSGAASSKSTEMGGGDTSGGAKEQSSAPPESSAANPAKPNPTMGTDKE